MTDSGGVGEGRGGKVLIAGAGGLVGSHLARALSPAYRVVALAHRDLDITDGRAVRRRVIEERPALVVNCAVVGVDECERDPELARAINVRGPRSLAEACAEAGAEFLHFSSNYVFDGAREDDAPYTFEDETHPVNIYGRTKLEGERAALDAAPRTFVVRTSWVYGAGKDSFLSTAHRNLLEGKPVRAITDVWASTTYVADLVARVGEILPRREYGVYQVVNEGSCSYYEFAREAARLAGLADERAQRLIEKVSEAGMQRAAPRPVRTPMRCLLSERLGLAPMPGWRAALARYVQSDSRGVYN